MVGKFIVHGLISFFCLMGIIFQDVDFWRNAAWVAFAVCCIFLFIWVFTSNAGLVAPLIIDVAIPCAFGFLLGLLVFHLNLVGCLFLSAVGTIIVPILATVYDM